MKMTSELAWLEEWYKAHCDGEWEHAYGIRIDTLDNPGWSGVIDVSGTNLEGCAMPRVARDEGHGDWMCCEVKNKKFEGHGDPGKLREILQLFRDWVGNQGRGMRRCSHGRGDPGVLRRASGRGQRTR